MLRLLTAVPFLLLSVCAAHAADGDVHEFRFDNGIELIVKEDHRAPVVVSQVWYRVGATDEPDGITGISHVLEHMMFKGTPAHPAGEFSRIVAENGGRENAFTSRDYTAYFQRFAKDRLPLSFELEADRMRNLTLPEGEFLKEIRVVMEERRMRTEDDPQALVQEQLYAQSFQLHPYRRPVIGWMDDLERMTIDDVRGWYRRWYAPSNATVVVVGDVEPEAVRALAERHFAPLKGDPVTPSVARREPPARGTRRVEVRAPAELPYVVMSWQTPSLKSAADDWEPYALEVLAGVLGAGSSSRLERELVRGKVLAAAASVGYELDALLPGLFLMDGTPAPGQQIGDLETALREQVARLRETPVSAEELQRVKAQVVAGEVYERDSGFYQAMVIGQYEATGLGWRKAGEYPERVRAITAEQVREVARKYLVDDNLTVARLDPLPLPEGRRVSANKGNAHVH